MVRREHTAEMTAWRTVVVVFDEVTGNASDQLEAWINPPHLHRYERSGTTLVSDYLQYLGTPQKRPKTARATRMKDDELSCQKSKVGSERSVLVPLPLPQGAWAKGKGRETDLCCAEQP